MVSLPFLPSHFGNTPMLNNLTNTKLAPNNIIIVRDANCVHNSGFAVSCVQKLSSQNKNDRYYEIAVDDSFMKVPGVFKLHYYSMRLAIPCLTA